MKKRNLKIDGMILGAFLSGVLYSATEPYITKRIMSESSASLIASINIVYCLGAIIFSTFWNKNSDRLFKYYPFICIIETISSIGGSIFVIYTDNIVGYYIICTVITTIITRNMLCGNIKIKTIRYKTEKERENYDNNKNSANALAVIIGSLIAMVINLNFIIMIIISTIGISIDNVFYIYYNIRKKSKIEN